MGLFQEVKISKKKRKLDQNIENTQDQKSFLCLPYVNEQHKRKVLTILRKNKLLATTKVSFTPGKKVVLNFMFISNSFNRM